MSAGLRVGDRVLYFSQRHGKDIEAEIIEANSATQQVQLNIKKGQWISADKVTPIYTGLGTVQDGLQNPEAPYIARIGSPSPQFITREVSPMQQANQFGMPACEPLRPPLGVGVPVAGPSLKKGDKVFLFSQSLGREIPAHVQEVHPDGSVELDVKKNQRLSVAEQAQRITRTYPPPPQLFRGDQVLYWTEKQVSDATVTNVDGATGSVELSIQPGLYHSPAEQQRMLRVVRERPSQPPLQSMDVGSPVVPPPNGAIVTPPTNGYVQANRPSGGAISPASQPVQWKHPIGSKVKYFSASNGDWIDAVVEGHNIEVGTYRLNVQQNADPARIRPPEDPSAAQPKAMGTRIISNPQAKAANKSGEKTAAEGTILEDKPDVKWDDIAGLQVAKDQLMMAVVLPTKFPNMFTQDRPPPRGILLYGPPGTGKTHLGRACASASSSTFFHVKASDIMSKFQGESEKSVTNLFATAKDRAPSIIFIDEVDSFFGKRGAEGGGESGDKRAVKNTFLQLMEDFSGKATPDKAVLVLAATNIPWELDEAFIRRFQAKIYIPPPDHEGRRYLIRQLLSNSKHTVEEEHIENFAEATRGYSGSDLKNLAHNALMRPVIDLQRATTFRRIEEAVPTGGSKIVWMPCAPNDLGAVQMRLLDVKEGEPFVRPVNAADFEAARLEVKASIQEGTLAKLEEWTQMYGSRA